MKHNLQSNFAIADHIAYAVKAASAQDGTALDMSLSVTAAFILVMALDGTAGDVPCKLQHSADSTTDWTDEVDGAGNTHTAVTLTADGQTGVLYVNNPRRRYYRVRATPTVADSLIGVTSVHGPLSSVAPT